MHQLTAGALWNLFIDIKGIVSPVVWGLFRTIPYVEEEEVVLSRRGCSVLRCPCSPGFDVREEKDAADGIHSILQGVHVYGDIHGQIQTLVQWINLNSMMQSQTPQLFLGDYVDRGSFSIEVALLLFALKALFPEKVFLLRGNHEDRNLNGLRRGNTLGNECDNRTPWTWRATPQRLFEAINDVFDWLPLAAVVGGHTFCVHGGIAPEVWTLGAIEALQRPFRVGCGSTDPQARFYDLLWSDPCRSTGASTELWQPNRVRGGSVTNSRAAVEQFLHRNGLRRIVRAHEFKWSGFDETFDGLVCTVFSAAMYCGRQNLAAALWIDEAGRLKVVTMPEAGTAGPATAASTSVEKLPPPCKVAEPPFPGAGRHESRPASAELAGPRPLRAATSTADGTGDAGLRPLPAHSTLPERAPLGPCRGSAKELHGRDVGGRGPKPAAAAGAGPGAAAAGALLAQVGCRLQSCSLDAAPCSLHRSLLAEHQRLSEHQQLSGLDLTEWD